MVDTTYKQAQAANELVEGTPGAGQEQITGAEVVGATSATNVDSGFTFSTLKAWVKLDADWMSKSVYDSGGDGRVDNAEQLNDGTNVVTAAQARTHIDNAGIHFVINDSSTAANVAWSGSKINTELAAKVSNGTSLGTGQGTVFAAKVGTNLQFKSLRQGSNVTITQTGTEITINSSGGIPEPADNNFGYLREGTGSQQWVRGARVFEQATAPSSPSVGDAWIDTT